MPPWRCQLKLLGENTKANKEMAFHRPAWRCKGDIFSGVFFQALL